MELSEIRKQIDEIDAELVNLFCRRMELSAQVAAYKKANNLPIFVPSREQEILENISKMSGPVMAQYAQALYTCLFQLSRNYQAKRNEVV